MIVFLIFAWCVVFGSLGWYVAKERGRPIEEGVALGAVFGIFGVLVVALLPPKSSEPDPPSTLPSRPRTTSIVSPSPLPPIVPRSRSE